MKKLSYVPFLLSLTVASMALAGCHNKKGTEKTTYDNATRITLSDEQITVNDEAVTSDIEAAVYTANDIVFYLEGQEFTYGEGTKDDAHTQEEADAHTVVHITEPGTYILNGSLSAGQIAVDLGEEAETDPEAVVTLVLDNVDIACSVAPAVIFYNVYECGTLDAESASEDVDTSAAGANVIIADDSTNNINGSYVARIYESYELTEYGTEVADYETLHKYDAAFYSKKSMNIDGEHKDSGVLNITAENEGLDSELHLTMNGGAINIVSGNDGINTNEDGISVTTINDGTLNIRVDGSTGEGDGIDSNGWLIINGGTVTAQACSRSGDAGIDADNGVYINGGTVMATGNMFDRLVGTEQNYAVFTFASSQTGGQTYTLKNSSDKTIASYTPENSFIYFVLSTPDLTAGDYTFWCDDKQLAGASGNRMLGDGMIQDFMNPENEIEWPEGIELPEGMENFEGGTLPENMQRPELPEGMERPEGGGMDGMQRPELPEGMEIPENGEIPQMPEGMERPEMPEGTDVPERPEDGEIPEGMEQPPNGQDGGRHDPFNNNGPSTETTTTFSIEDGANFFSQVGPASV